MGVKMYTISYLQCYYDLLSEDYKKQYVITEDLSELQWAYKHSFVITASINYMDKHRTLKNAPFYSPLIPM